MRSRSLEVKRKVLEGVGAFIAMPRLKGSDFMDEEAYREPDLEVEGVS